MTTSRTGGAGATARWPGRVLVASLAALAYLPLLFNRPGEVSADTKTYLTLDPSRLLSRAPELWDRHIGMGTVTHQNIGYLFPMGPYYWIADRLAVPDWITQRLWLGTLLFAASLGVVWLARVLGWKGAGVAVAAAGYGLSPYLLDYAARISVILMPWAGLPWLLGATVLALRKGGWRWPAVFALIIALVGAVNATALLFVGLGPVLWIAYATWVTREVPWRRAAAATARIGGLTLAVSLWWIAALSLQGRYGIPVLNYTETYEAISRTSTSAEVMRGLGYWFFYGRDKLDPWVQSSSTYTHQPMLLAITYAIPALALVSAVVVRSVHRRYFLALAVIGTICAVGAHPFAAPTIGGQIIKDLMTTTAGLAMRSTPRAIPLLALGLAVLLGTGADALAGRLTARWPALRPRVAEGLVSTAGVLLAVAALAPLVAGDLYSVGILRPEQIPAYWPEAAAAMDAGGSTTRVLETPGADFASYRWGSTVDPVTPGLMDRPYVARELIPYGSAASADVLNAFEQRLQDGVFEPSSVAPLARLLSIGTVALRSDLQYERYRTPRPRLAWAAFNDAGLSAPRGFGDPVPNRAIARVPMIDGLELTTPPGAPEPPPVALFDVPSTRPIVRAEPATGPLVVAGDGAGLVDLAAAGLLDATATVRYSASMSKAELSDALTLGASLVVTDTNRRQGRRWGTVQENTGYTEQAGEQPLRADPTDNRLAVFPGATDDAFTVTQQRGVAHVQATAYGNPVTFTPEDRPAQALDGDPTTAWRVGAFADVGGERFELQLSNPVTTDHLRLLQPINGARNRWITKARLRFDGGQPVDVVLGDSSRAVPGEVLTFSPRTFTTLSIEILATNFTKLPGYRGVSAVGIAELDVAGARVDEVVRLPVDLLAQAGSGASAHPLSIVMTRLRADQHEPNRADPELSIARTFALPAARDFSLTGSGRVSGVAPDEALDAVISAATAPSTPAATSNARLVGDPTVRGQAAVDGNPNTAWQTPISDVVGSALTVTSTTTVTVDHLDLRVIADGRHSVPTQLAVSADGGPAALVTVPPIADQPAEGATGVVSVAVPARSGRRFTFAITAVREVTSPDYFSELPVALPVAIAELGAPALTAPPTGAIGRFDSGCRTDLLTIDGAPVAVRLTGTTADALSRGALSLTACGPPLTLGAGDHVVRTAQGRRGGLDLDRLVLASPAPATVGAVAGPVAAPTVAVVDETSTHLKVRVSGATTPFWLVLGQSNNAGWAAHLDGGPDLGPPTLVDGYANGWFVKAPAGSSFDVTLDWTPQRTIWVALGLSALALVAVVALAIWDPRRRRTTVWPGVQWTEPQTTAAAEGPDRTGVIAMSWRTTLVAAAVLAIGFGALAGAMVGAVALAVTVAAARLAPLRWRRLLAVLPALCFLAVLGYVLAKQRRYEIPTDLEWPRAFAPVHTIGWAALAATVALVTVDELRRRRQPDRRAGDEAVRPAR